jgi:hypothetical protein
MAKATKTTERVEKVIYEDKDVINVTMTPEEATAVYSALWLMEMSNMENSGFLAMKGVQDALAMALNFPVAQFRFDNDHSYNTESSIYIYPRD